MKSIIRNGGFYLLVLVVLAFASYSAAIAQVNFTNDQGQFIGQNPGLAFQDFSAANAAPGTLTTCAPAPVDENSNNLCFQPGDILPGIAFLENPGIPVNDVLVLGQNVFGAGNPPNVLSNNTLTNSLDILFTLDPTAIGLVLGCVSTSGSCNRTIVVEVFGLGDVLLDSETVPVTGLTDSFIGIESQVPITRVSLDFLNLPAAPEVKTILNVRFGEQVDPAVVPTLSEWGLITMAGLLGIVGFMVIRRRQVTA